jgi:uncharacterized protein (DUF2345 family)
MTDPTRDRTEAAKQENARNREGALGTLALLTAAGTPALLIAGLYLPAGIAALAAYLLFRQAFKP